MPDWRSLLPVVREDHPPAKDDLGGWAEPGEHDHYNQYDSRPPARQQDNADLRSAYDIAARATAEAAYQKGRADTLDQQGNKLFDLAKELINRPAQITKTFSPTYHKAARPKGGKTKKTSSGIRGWIILAVTGFGVICLIAIASVFKTPAAAPPPQAPVNLHIQIGPQQPRIGHQPNSY